MAEVIVLFKPDHLQWSDLCDILPKRCARIEYRYNCPLLEGT
jgi:hypothetical protein